MTTDGTLMPRTYTATFTRDDAEDTELTVEYTFSPGRPATPPAYSHGGLPPEDPEVEILGATHAETGAKVDLTDEEVERWTIRIAEEHEGEYDED